MKIELLYFDGCTAYQTALKHLEEVIQEKKLDAQVEMVKIENDGQAGEKRFLGSPSIRINGQDIEPGAQQIREFSMRCRLYLEGDQVNEWPGKGLIRRAIEQALHHND
jgi:hypothetical protein